MGSTLAFKITASLIKPTREALMDYCSYILLIIALVGMARILIGMDDLKYGCRKNGFENQTDIILKPILLPINETKKEVFTENVELKNSTKTNFTEEKFCLKYRQTYFPYFVLIEAAILLLTGILWVKMPKIQSTITKFSKLLHKCQNSNWCNILNSPKHPYLATNKMLPAILQSDEGFVILLSYYTVLRFSKKMLSDPISTSDPVNMELNLLLEVLFNNETNYKDKSQARLLYEEVQKFCSQNEQTKIFCKSYVRKSVFQFVFWVMSFAINMYLFIVLEFYVDCLVMVSDGYCDHDEFLRVIWYMSQVVIIVYGIFNATTLRWINGKFKINFCKSVVYESKGKNSSVHHFMVGKRKIRNDMALLLHLVVTTKHRGLPYFTVFLFDQWKEMFSKINNADGVLAFGHGGSSSTDHLMISSGLSFKPSRYSGSSDDST